MHITFRIAPFAIRVSSHGYFTIRGDGLPMGGSLPGCLEAADIEPLNRTWDSEGREPVQMEPHDDGVPGDLEDPRLARCVNRYVDLHLDRLLQLYAAAQTAWAEMQRHSVDVEGVSVRPGQRIRLWFAKDGVREHAENKGEMVFYGYGRNEATMSQYSLYLSEYTVTLRGVKDGSFRHWIEPLGE